MVTAPSAFTSLAVESDASFVAASVRVNRLARETAMSSGSCDIQENEVSLLGMRLIDGSLDVRSVSLIAVDI